MSVVVHWSLSRLHLNVTACPLYATNLSDEPGQVIKQSFSILLYVSNIRAKFSRMPMVQQAQAGVQVYQTLCGGSRDHVAHQVGAIRQQDRTW